MTFETIAFNSTLRSSSRQVLAVCLSDVSPVFWTVDAASINLWSLSKQLKATYFSKDTLAGRRFVDARFNHDTNSCMILLTQKRKNFGGEASNGVLQIWSANLMLIQQLFLYYDPVNFFLLNPLKSEILLFTNSCKCVVLNYENLMTDTTNVSQLFSTTRKESTLSAPVSTGSFVSTLSGKVQLLEKQIFEYPVSTKIAAVELSTIDGSILLLAEDGKVYVISELASASLKYHQEENSCIHILKMLKEGNAQKMIRDSQIIKLYEVAKALDFGYLGDSINTARVVRHLDVNMLLVGFTKGNVVIVRTDMAMVIQGTVETKTLSVFNTDISGIKGYYLGEIHQCNYLTAANTSFKVFDYQFITSGSDMKIQHWGCRYEDDFRMAMTSTLLDEHGINANPPSHAVSIKPGMSPQREYVPSHILSFEMSRFGLPCRKFFIASSGGLLLIFESHQSRIKLPLNKTEIVCSAHGPLAERLQFPDIGDERNGAVGSLIVCRENSVDVVDSCSGKRYCKISQADFQVMDSSSFATIQPDNVHASSGLYPSRNRKVLLEVSGIYYCVHTNHIAVGMTTGEIILFSQPRWGGSEPIGRSVLPTDGVHSMPVCSMKSFCLHSSSSSGNEALKVCLVAVDEVGIMSTWMISAAAGKKKSKAGGDATMPSFDIELAQKDHAHRRAFLDLFHFNFNDRFNFLMTACTNGAIKMWSVDSEGSFKMLAFFNTEQPNLSSLCPVPYARKIPCSTPEGLPKESLSFTVVCGFRSGMLELWLMSTEPHLCSARPHLSIQINSTMVTHILDMGFFNPLWTDGLSRRFSSCGEAVELAVAYENGIVNIVEVYDNGIVNWLDYFIQSPVRRMYVPHPLYHPSSKEIIMASDTCIYTAIVQAKGSLAKKWTNSLQQVIKKDIFIAQPDATSLTSSQAEDDALRDEGGGSSLEGSLSSQEEKAACSLDGDPLSSLDLESAGSLSTFDVPSKRSLAASLDRSERSSMKKALSIELSFTKKDVSLADMFRQSEHLDRKTNEVGVEAAVDIVHAWFGLDRPIRESILELIAVLGLRLADKIQFLNVAKIAAVMSSALRLKYPESVGHVSRSYADMRQSTNRVVYNSLGEKSILRTELPPGLFNRYIETVRAVWAEQTFRVDARLDRDSRIEPTTLLRKLPLSLKRFLRKNVELPTAWVSTNPHWFDVRRTVRIARTLLDLRSSKQYVSYITYNELGNFIEPDSFPKIVMQYFEHNFGTGEVRIAHTKAVHFVEACLQYSHYPVLAFCNHLLVPELCQPISRDCLWLYLEARSYLTSKSKIVQGDAVPISSLTDGFTHHSFGAYQTQSNINWLLVTRLDALACVDEMLRVRGEFGSDVQIRMLSVIDCMPSVSHDNPELDFSDLVDMELFLDIFAEEFSRIEQTIAMLEKSAFGVTSLMGDVLKMPGGLTDLYEANFMPFIDKFKGFMYQFCQIDSKRNGVVSITNFKNVITSAAVNINAFAKESIDTYLLCEVCVQSYRSNVNDDSVCYADFWAVILAWVQLTRGSEEFNCQNLVKAIKTTKRGIEESQVAAIVALINYVQCPQSSNPMWTCPSKLDPDSLRVSDKSSIPRDGTWRVDTRPPEEAPGLLLIQKVQTHVMKKRSLDDKLVEAKLQKSQERVAPVVLVTNREIRNASNEMCRPDALEGKAEAPLHCQDITSGVPHVGNSRDVSIASKYSRDLSRSFSRSMSNLDRAFPLSKMAQSQSQIRDISAGLNADEGFDSTTSSSASSINSRFRVSRSLEIMEKTDMEKTHVYGNSLNNRSLITSSLDKERVGMTLKDVELHQMMEIEARRQAARLEKQQQEQRRLKREMRLKYRESMQDLARFAAQRDRRRDNVLRLQEKMKNQADADYLAKVEAERAKLAAVKELQARQKAERDAVKALEDERHRECEELLAMRHAEQYMHAYYEAYAEKVRLEKEKAEKAAVAAAEKARKEREQRERAEAEAAAKAAEEAAAAARAAERESERFNRRDMGTEDINVLQIKLSGEEEKVDEEDPSRATTAASEAVAEEALEEVVVSAAESKMQAFLLRLERATTKQLEHPRRDRKAGEFFFPLNFSADITFSPFASSAFPRRPSSPPLPAATASKPSTATIATGGGEGSDGPLGDNFIKKAIRQHKVDLAEHRRKQLFETSEANVTSDEWTNVFRSDSVDWIRFFLAEKHLLNFHPPPEPEPVDEEKEFLQAIGASAPPVAEEKGGPDSHDFLASQSLHNIDFPNQGLKITPMPFGKVCKDVAYPEVFNYYQVEVVDRHSILTIELHCLFGFADVYIARNRLPTMTSFDECKYYNQVSNRERLTRMVLDNDFEGIVFIGVYADAGAKYDIWTACTGDQKFKSDAVLRVSKTLRGLEVLANNTIDDLHVHLPRLYTQAHQIADAELKFVQSSILTDMTTELEKLPPGFLTNTEIEDGEDFDVLDRFVCKQGRHILRKKMTSASAKEVAAEDYKSLLMHPEMFVRPVGLLHSSLKKGLELSLPIPVSSAELLAYRRSMMMNSMPIATKKLLKDGKEYSESDHVEKDLQQKRLAQLSFVPQIPKPKTRVL